MTFIKNGVEKCKNIWYIYIYRLVLKLNRKGGNTMNDYILSLIMAILARLIGDWLSSRFFGRNSKND